MTALLLTLARILWEYRASFGGCDGCDGTFDFEFTHMAHGEEVTLCPACVAELTERSHGSMDEVGMY